MFVDDVTRSRAFLAEEEGFGSQLLRQRLDLLARRYLRDLRRQAYVDIRA